MTTVEAIEAMKTTGKIADFESLRLLALPSQDLQIAAVSAITEREFRNEIRSIKQDIQALKLFVAKDKIRRECRTEISNIFRVMLKEM